MKLKSKLPKSREYPKSLLHRPVSQSPTVDYAQLSGKAASPRLSRQPLGRSVFLLWPRDSFSGSPGCTRVIGRLLPELENRKKSR